MENSLLAIFAKIRQKIPCTIAHGFFRKMAQKSPPIFITFSDTY